MPSDSRDLIRRLTPLHGAGEARAIVGLLMEERFHLSQTDVLLGREARLSAQERAAFGLLAARLLTGEPVQYVLGYTTFCGHRFRVSPEVLIPRPETEELVKRITAMNHCAHRGMHTPVLGRGVGDEAILDLCTGSGCIAISLALAMPDAQVTAVDISAAALDVARQNARDLGAHNVRFLQADVLKDDLAFGNQSFTILTANPPYVRDSEANDMSPTVLRHEPHLALFVPDEDPLRFYRVIADTGQRLLRPGGLVVVELNTALAEQTLRLFEQRGYIALELHDDQFGHTRFLEGKVDKLKIEN